MNFAIVILIIVALFAYSAGKLIEQQPASRMIQGVIALVGGVLVVLGAGWLR